MFSNYNIWKYCSKYFFILIGSAYVIQISSGMVNDKSDVENLIGTTLFAGLFMFWLLILKSDVTKLIKNLKKEDNKDE